MKILQFGKLYPPSSIGGIETTIANITEGLNESKISCDVLCCNSNNKYSEEKIENYQIIRAKSWFNLFSTYISPQLISKLKEIQNNYDIIHVHLPDPMANLALFLTKPKAKIIIHWHSDIIKQKVILKFYKPLLKWLIKRADLVITATPAHAKYSDFSDLFVHKIALIPFIYNEEQLNITPNKRFLSELGEKFQNKKVVFTLGRLIYYKGHEYLIKAANFLSEDYVILIGGEGVLREKLEKLIIKFNLQNKVYLLGRVPDEELNVYYSFCNIFCFPSVYRSEMFGLVQLDAMHFGKPIVATNIPRSGVPFVNIDGVTGLNVEPKNEKELAEAIEKICSNKELYNKFSANAQKIVKEKYSAKKIIKALVDVYQELLSR